VFVICVLPLRHSQWPRPRAYPRCTLTRRHNGGIFTVGSSQGPLMHTQQALDRNQVAAAAGVPIGSQCRGTKIAGQQSLSPGSLVFLPDCAIAGLCRKHGGTGHAFHGRDLVHTLGNCCCRAGPVRVLVCARPLPAVCPECAAMHTPEPTHTAYSASPTNAAAMLDGNPAFRYIRTAPAIVWQSADVAPG
jgi:hypothetical protein